VEGEGKNQGEHVHDGRKPRVSPTCQNIGVCPPGIKQLLMQNDQKRMWQVGRAMKCYSAEEGET